MLEMLPVEERQELAALCARHALQPQDAVYAFVADQNGETLGHCVARLAGERVEVLAADIGAANDWLLLDGLFRAVLHFGQRRGAKTARFAPALTAGYPELCARLTYDTKRECQIDEILTKCKS